MRTSSKNARKHAHHPLQQGVLGRFGRIVKRLALKPPCHVLFIDEINEHGAQGGVLYRPSKPGLNEVPGKIKEGWKL